MVVVSLVTISTLPPASIADWIPGLSVTADSKLTGAVSVSLSLATVTSPEPSSLDSVSHSSVTVVELPPSSVTD